MNFQKSAVLRIILVFSLAFNAAFTGISAYHLLSTADTKQDEPPQRPGIRRSAEPMRWMERLDLSGEQRERVHAKREELSQQLLRQREEAKTIRARLIALLEEPESDSEDIAAVADEYHRVQSAMRNLIFENLLDIRELLSEEQKKQLGGALMQRYTPRRGAERRKLQQD